MKIVELKQLDHDVKIGHQPGNIEPNVTEDSLFVSGGKPVGFYLSSIPEGLMRIVNIANTELNSKRVPKSTMKRQSSVEQYSCILGSIPPKPTFRRNYPTKSSVHSVPTAQNFIKAMIIAGIESLKLIKEVEPSIYDTHRAAVEERVPPSWRFAELFSSSISNYNIAAPIHRDTLNVVGAVNVIITKRQNSVGGNLYVPDYEMTFNSSDNSMIVYPAWKNSHGVTPIIPTRVGGYRNSLIWYALDAFNSFRT